MWLISLWLYRNESYIYSFLCDFVSHESYIAWVIYRLSHTWIESYKNWVICRGIWLFSLWLGHYILISLWLCISFLFRCDFVSLSLWLCISFFVALYRMSHTKRNLYIFKGDWEWDTKSQRNESYNYMTLFRNESYSMDKSCHTSKCIMALMWMRHVTNILIYWNCRTKMRYWEKIKHLWAKKKN